VAFTEARRRGSSVGGRNGAIAVDKCSNPSRFRWAMRVGGCNFAQIDEGSAFARPTVRRATRSRLIFALARLALSVLARAWHCAAACGCGIAGNIESADVLDPPLENKFRR
jgi:hypothetical protein